MQKIILFAFLLTGCLSSTVEARAQHSHGAGTRMGAQLQPKPAVIRLFDANLRQACNQYKVLMSRVPAGRLPKTYHMVTDRLETSDARWWTSGFYPGALLYLYSFSHDTSLLHEALRRLPLLAGDQYETDTHDLGFMVYCSYGEAERLVKQGLIPPGGYDTVLMNSARSLSKRFNPIVGCIRSWDTPPWKFPVIIDNMMNLELLMWGTRFSGDSTFYRIAVTHANTTLRNQFRPDHSSYHVVDYDSATGAILAKKTAQGYADSSAWARGQSWGLYGYTMMYRYTHDTRYLEQAEAIADFLLNNPDLPADKIPYWDYNAPGVRPGAPVNPGVPRDASAAAIMASALVELCRYAGMEKGRVYLDAAEQILLTLSSNNFKAIVGSNGGFILKHSVGNLPGKTEIDVPLTYADYYFVEAMLRYKQLGEAFQAGRPMPGPNSNPNGVFFAAERMQADLGTEDKPATGALANAARQTPAPANAPRLINVAPGWAKNSINAVVFRHNSVISFRDTQFIAFYDGDSRLVLGKRRLGERTWTIQTTPYKGHTRDAHNAISLMVDGAGYLHLSWDHHNSPLRYCQSIRPCSLVLTAEMPMTGRHEEKVTYPEFYKMPGGDLLFLYRDGASGNGNLVIDKYDLKTRRWIQLQEDLIDGEGKRNAYWQACVDDRGTLHLSWVWRESPDVASNHDLCYARSRDGGLTWERSDGSTYRLPITASTAEYACHIPMHSGLINQTSMCADKEGLPYIASYWRPGGSAIPQYQLVWREGSGWRQTILSSRTKPFSLEGAGTKEIPISRPQIFLSGEGNKRGAGLAVGSSKQRAFLVFRDAERGNRPSVAECDDFPQGSWQFRDLSEMALDAWEPSYDTELWKNKGELDLFVEKVEQEDSEGTKDVAPQMVSVLEWRPE